MASVLGSAVLNLTTDATKLNRGLKQAEKDTDASLTRMQRLGNRINAAAPYVAIGGAAAGAGLAIKGMLDDVANIERELRPHLARTGLAADDLQHLGEVARRLGSEDPFEGITDSIQEMNLQIGEGLAGAENKGTKALQAIGLSLEDLEGKSDLQKFNLVLDTLHRIDDTEMRTFYADEIFGGAWQGQAGLITANADAIGRVREEVEKTFKALTDEDLERLNKYNQEMDGIRQTWQELKQDFVLDIVPGITGAMSHINEQYDESQQRQEDFNEDMALLWDEWRDKIFTVAASVGPGIRPSMEEIPAVIGDVMTSEEMDLSGYFAGQKEPIGTALSEITEVARSGVQGLVAEFNDEMSAIGSATHDALLGGGAEGEGNLMPSGSVMAAFQQFAPEVKKIIEQGFGEYITPSWMSGLSDIGSATWDAFYGSAEGEGSFSILPTFDKAFNTEIPDYIKNAVPTIRDETDYLMQDGIQAPVTTGLEEAATLMTDGMDTLQEKVSTAVSPMMEAVTDYGERTIVQPITSAVLAAGNAVNAKLAEMEAAAAATAAALSGSLVSGSLARSIEGHAGFNPNEWERQAGDPWNQFGGAYYENTRTGQKISTRLYQSRRLAYFQGQHNRVLGGAADSGNPLGQEHFRSMPMPTLPGLPQMDNGGIVSGPTLAALAMNSRPEAVIPLDRMGTGGMGGVQIIFNDAVYGLEDFNEKVQEAVLTGRREGRQDLI